MKKLNVLLIDNDTHYKQKLRNLLAAHDLTVIDYTQIGEIEQTDYDVIVLSGGGIKTEDGRRRSLKRFSHLYEDQIKLVKEAKVPIVGICLGCQIIGHAYGAKLSRQFKIRRKGLSDIVTIRHSAVMGDLQEATVFQSNRWIITDLPDDLICIAASDEGAEVIRHRSKPLYGVQFHPERRVGKNDGAKIFNNILKVIFSK
ncbi:gamma-glutamyl-gamma-aminobutyrate hydrolase family protein [bacterium]|nr:gamma-glutamyl-gamma-aminobutyrate hydrolase family protein [bacterium]